MEPLRYSPNNRHSLLMWLRDKDTPHGPDPRSWLAQADMYLEEYAPTRDELAAEAAARELETARKSGEYQKSDVPDSDEAIENERGKAVEKAAKKVGAKKNTIYSVRRLKRAGPFEEN